MGNPITETDPPTQHIKTSNLSDETKKAIIQEYLDRIDDLVIAQPDSLLAQTNFICNQIIRRTDEWLIFPTTVSADAVSLLGAFSGVLLKELDRLKQIEKPAPVVHVEMPQLTDPVKVKILAEILDLMPGDTCCDATLMETMAKIRTRVSGWLKLVPYDQRVAVQTNYRLFRQQLRGAHDGIAAEIAPVSQDSISFLEEYLKTMPDAYTDSTIRAKAMNKAQKKIGHLVKFPTWSGDDTIQTAYVKFLNAITTEIEKLSQK